MALGSGIAACVPGAQTPPAPSTKRPPDPSRVPSDSAQARVETTPASTVDTRVEALRAEFGSRGFTVMAQAPWVVVGDEPASEVKRRAEGTVAWATERLAAAYFARSPDPAVEVWLFRDEKSYYANAKSIFNDEPYTPFGYYSHTHEALIMNIASGGGTLVHEMVHPLMHSNFPACPSWFNEGLASLYEQCGDRNGEIVGHTNWRLAGLQEAIARKAVPSFETLVATSEQGFYDDDPGSNYGQARYLCFWLQEQGNLRAFYRDFVANAAHDPTGIETLRKHVGTSDLGAFKRDWERFVTGLRFDA